MVEDATALFWKAIAVIEQKTGKDDPHKILFESHRKYTHTAFRQAVLIYEDSAFRLGRDVFNIICDQVAEAVTFRPEFKSLLNRLTESPTIGAVMVTCGHRLIWEKVLKKAEVSDQVQVIGGGTLNTGYIVTPSVKGAVVESLHEAVVVVGEADARSKTMDEKLPRMLASRQVKVHQLLLPITVQPRLDFERPPVISMLEIEEQIKMPLMPGLLHATKKGATQILMAQTRNAQNCGPLLQDAHRQVGRYLAMEYLPTAIGLESYLIPHVQAGKSVEASRILNEDKILIVALMRGGLPMAEGVNSVLQLASILHAKTLADLKQTHLDPQSAVVLVAGVINNGDTIKDFVHHIRALAPNMPIFVVADVVQSQSVSRGGAVCDLSLLIEALNLRPGTRLRKRRHSFERQHPGQLVWLIMVVTIFSLHRLCINLMFLPPHRPTVNLAALQQPPLDSPGPSLLFVWHCPNILPLECTKDPDELKLLHPLPYEQNVVWMQRDAVWNTPEERETQHSWLTRNRVRSRRNAEDRISDEEVVVPVKQQRAREMSASDNCGHARAGQEFRVRVFQQPDVCARRVGAF
nr:hypothetical protein CFP56_33485 [Quercus suber]